MYMYVMYVILISFCMWWVERDRTLDLEKVPTT